MLLPWILAESTAFVAALSTVAIMSTGELTNIILAWWICIKKIDES
jgi:hypothetical protein